MATKFIQNVSKVQVLAMDRATGKPAWKSGYVFDRYLHPHNDVRVKQTTPGADCGHVTTFYHNRVRLEQ